MGLGYRQEENKRRRRVGRRRRYIIQTDQTDNECLFVQHNYCKLTQQIVNRHPLVTFIKSNLSVIKLCFQVKYFTLKHYSAFLTSRLRFCSLDRNNSSCKIQRNKSAATVAFFSSPDRIAKRPQSHNRDGCVLSGNSSAALTTADFHHSAFHVCQTSCQRLTNSIHKKKKPSLVFQLLTAPDACWVNYSNSVHQGNLQRKRLIMVHVHILFKDIQSLQSLSY